MKNYVATKTVRTLTLPDLTARGYRYLHSDGEYKIYQLPISHRFFAMPIAETTAFSVRTKLRRIK
jgi:hypothetical protein